MTEASGGRDYTVASTALADDDTVAPTVPGRPAATSTVPGTVDLTWAASHDNRATSIRYTIYRDDPGTVAGAVSSSSTGSVTFLDTGLAPGTSHSYSVTAGDGVNTSAPSAWSDPVTVPAGDPPLLEDGFSSGLSGWTTVVNMTADNLRFPAGSTSPSARAAVSNQAGYATDQLSATAPAICAQANVLVSSLASPTLSLIRLRTLGGSSIGRVYVTSSGFLSVRADVTGAVLTSSARMSFGTWNQVRICGTTGSSGTWQIALNGTSVGSWTAGNGATDFGRVQIGDSDPRTATLNVDDVLVTRQ